MFKPLCRAVKAGLILMAVLAAGVLGGSVWSALRARCLPPTTQHAGPTIQQVRALAALVTTRITVADAITSEVSGMGGSMSAVLVIRGDALITIDLEHARFSSIDPASKRLVLDLPSPSVIQARVDHSHTKLFAVQRHGLWKLMRLDDVTRQLVDTGLREAQQTIEKAASDQAILATAQEHAQQVLAAFASSAGWQLTIRWDVPAGKP